MPVGLGDVRVEFASTVEVEATIRFLHPTHNFAIVQYRRTPLVNPATLQPCNPAARQPGSPAARQPWP